MYRILEISVHYGPKLSYFKFEVYMISLSMGLELSRTTEMSLGSLSYLEILEL
jgi:hypothetical protein